ncbi:ABC transporter [Thalassobaculum fulvum]|uniref:ABC transporter n=1 Tax=Thalassobaculum fulvum TaxID=1633335 RepID=A0A918XVK2_9PROT|nr:extracellular solute-binding protein [Thalassobaculum fulvum]GHD56900.1 ABC transporter [Thalassobaculum fulvum]
MPTARLRAAAVLLLGFALGLPAAVPAAAAEYSAPPSHGIAMHGDLKYAPDFTHFEYVEPNAPKGGTLVSEATGSFDSFNPFILRGQPASGVALIYDTLTEQAQDEPFSEYGALAESIEMPADRSWVAFNLRPEARWHDGRPVTAGDVVWTFDTLVEKGAPFYRAYYGDVVEVKATSEHRVLFVFKGPGNRELPLILGQLAVLPKHWWQGKDFANPPFEPPLGSGPYRVKGYEAGRTVTYERVADYWGKDVPAMRGRWNADTIRYEYFRDRDIATEAFKAGAFDLRAENSSKRWATAYSFPGLDAGMAIKEEVPHQNVAGMQGFVFNTRRPVFRDRTVREAIGYAFDFEWTNKALMYGAYTRTDSYFDNSELGSSGLPTGAELALLEPFRDRLPPEVFTTEFTVPKTDGSGNPRQNLRTALKLLREAGWAVKNGVLTNAEGQALSFEILLVSPDMERIVLPFAANLEKLGIKASVRTVDPAQFQNRVRDFDFDMIVGSFGQSQSPGNEQRDYWSSAMADLKGSRNVIGVRDPVVDALVEKVIQAPDREALVAATRALDRVLLWGFYVVPHFHSETYRLVYWNKFGKPAVAPKYGLGYPDTWWIDPAKAAAVEAWRRGRS